MPIFEFCSRAFCVEYAKGSAKIPQGPARIQCTQNVEVVVEPSQHHIRRSVLVTAHLAKVNGNPLGCEFGPGMKECGEGLAVANDLSFVVLQRPRRQRLSAGQDATHPLALMVGELNWIVSMAALKHAGGGEIRNRQTTSWISVGYHHTFRVVLSNCICRRFAHARIVLRV